MLENIDIDMVILENIDIDKAILQNIDIDKISNRFKFGISNRASREGSILVIGLGRPTSNFGSICSTQKALKFLFTDMFYSIIKAYILALLSPFLVLQLFGPRNMIHVTRNSRIQGPGERGLTPSYHPCHWVLNPSLL